MKATSSRLFYYILLIAVLSLPFSLTSCSDDEDNIKTNDLEKKYFSIENATYSDETFPTSTNNTNIEGLSINEKALTGGMNFITVVTEKAYRKFFVGVKGVKGYYTVSTEQTSQESQGYKTYTIPIMYSTEYKSDIVMLISAEDMRGDITEAYNAEVQHVSSESGDLNINLTFNNEKDVDLHLITPSGEHIYYGARGGSVETVDGNIITYGLDHDSNAGCHIDGLNNENIYIPAEKIEIGTYKVIIDMYSNCNRSIATSWSVIARYKGNIIPTVTGYNPATGVYPIGSNDHDMTAIMTFTINDINKDIKKIKLKTFNPIPRSDLDDMKMEEAMFYINK
ncbi:MAG: hypothetical protein KHX42_05910 [Prevotella sp.]|nr:hypothetical protein [Prevotella sp.]